MARVSPSAWFSIVIMMLSLVVVNSQTTGLDYTTADAGVTAPVATDVVTEIVTEETPLETPRSQNPGSTVNTTTGMVSGLSMSLLGVTVDLFRGIPYAEPPVEDLRFAKPRPRKSWEGTYEAFEYGTGCPQSGRHGEESVTDEDCLSLNVFIPRERDSLVPVMVYIHGGAFISGSGRSFETLAAFGEVMVVTINYRLGVFGFLSTGDDYAKGNWGLWDQRLALQWVKENAERFGGDPEQITIFGASAGANSVLYQILSPLNTNQLFQRAISQSAIHFNFLRNDATTAAKLTSSLAQNIGYDQPSDSNLLIPFLRDQSVESLLEEAANLQRDLTNFYPVIDGEFIQESGTFNISSKFDQYDLLIGINTGDASSMWQGEQALNEETFLAHVATILKAFCQDLGDCKGLELAVQAATFAYNDIQVLQNDELLNLVRILEMGFEAAFASTTSNIARLHSKSGGNTFAYEFAYEDANRGRFPLPPNVVPNPLHGAESYYLSGSALTDMTAGNMDESVLSYAFMSYWTNFARNGDPNVGDTQHIDETWPQFDLETQSYLILKPNATVGHDFAAESYAFWYGYIRNLLEEAEKKDPEEEDPDEEDPDEEDMESCSINGTVPEWDTLSPPEMKVYDIVDTNNVALGSIYGTVDSVNDDIGSPQVHVIRGIPYAKPPLGSLRFKPPKDVEPWEGTLNGTLPAPECPDPKAQDWDEDCLTLDIAAVNGALLPVIVFINGYDFQSGGKTPSAEILASGTGSVVVTARYRLGALGFLSTGDKYAQGNYGLLDVVSVLKWIKNYIGSFKGDPNNVTLMGYGTGGTIVNLMLSSKLAENLFHSAISLSGTAASRILHPRKQPDPLKQAISLGKKIDCEYKNGDTKGLIYCLQHENATVSDILDATKSFSTPVPFFPVVDNYFLTDSVENILQDDSFPTLAYNYLIGLTEDQEAARLMRMAEKDDTCLTEDEFQEHVSYYINMYLNDPGPVRQAIVVEYLENLPPPSDDNPCPVLERFVEFLNDFFAVIPTLHAAKAHTKAGGRVYLYSFQHTPKCRSNHTAHLPSWIGPTFGDDLKYVFGIPYAEELPECYGQEDWQTTLVLMDILRNFIKTGDPNGIDGINWPVFGLDSRQYLEVDACPTVSETGFGNSRLLFWTELIPSLTSSPPIEEEECFVGHGLGILLSPKEAAKMIQIMIGVSIALLVIIVLICGAFCGMRKQLKDNKTSAYELEHDLPTSWNTDESAYL